MQNRNTITGKVKNKINNITIMRRYIQVTKETRSRLVKKYGVTKKTVWEALSFITKNERSQGIRRDALEWGGLLIEEGFVPNCRTEHLGDGKIRQSFSNSIVVMIEGNKATIYRDGMEIESYEGITLNTWGNILDRAQRLSETGEFETIMQ